MMLQRNFMDFPVHPLHHFIFTNKTISFSLSLLPFTLVVAVYQVTNFKPNKNRDNEV